MTTTTKATTKTTSTATTTTTTSKATTTTTDAQVKCGVKKAGSKIVGGVETQVDLKLLDFENLNFQSNVIFSYQDMVHNWI